MIIQDSIERRLILRTLLGICIVFLLAVLAIDRLIVDWLSNEYDNNLLSKARILVTLTKEHEDNIELDFADEFMPEFEREESPEFFQLWLDNEEVFERSRSLGERNLPKVNLEAVGHVFNDIELFNGRDGRVVTIVFVPQIDKMELRTKERLARQKNMTLAVAMELESLQSITLSVHLILLSGSVFIILILFFVIHTSVRKGLRPLNSIASQLQTIDVNSLDERLKLDSVPAELANIVGRFNELMEQLEDSFTREKQFSSDVAHELRTPIAELRNIAEIFLKWPDDIRLQQSMATDVLQSSFQMVSIVDNLLSLARCESGTLSVQFSDIDLAERIDLTWSRLENSAAEKGIQFVREFEQPAISSSSIIEFDLILINILSNAIAYSPDNSTIVARITQGKEHFSVCFSNSALNLVPDDITTLFDRFWRKDKSRTSESHSGLGLSLVKAYAKQLNIKLHVSIDKEQILTFCLLELPAKQ